MAAFVRNKLMMIVWYRNDAIRMFTLEMRLRYDCNISVVTVQFTCKLLNGVRFG